jgi:2',3'-cyclic-nucleotide 2'-phosphodiesterase (5'-nucleotidase family)
MSPSDSPFSAIDISTRPKRRRAVSHIITLLSRIRQAESDYLERIPQNLTGSDAYVAADESIDIVTDAIAYLMDAY